MIKLGYNSKYVRFEDDVLIPFLSLSCYLSFSHFFILILLYFSYFRLSKRKQGNIITTTSQSHISQLQQQCHMAHKNDVIHYVI